MAGGIGYPRPDEVYELSENDYRFGVGPIVVRVVNVVNLIQFDNKPWWHVEANAANGTPKNHGGWISRVLYIRESKLAQIHEARRIDRGA